MVNKTIRILQGIKIMKIVKFYYFIYMPETATGGGGGGGGGGNILLFGLSK